MENTTKSRILEEALIMFAENGYKGTNLRDLAARLGFSKSALYKHYSSKEDIWNALLDRMEVIMHNGLVRQNIFLQHRSRVRNCSL